MTSPSPARPSERDERLADLLAELSEKAAARRAGRRRRRSARDHPDLADELRELWAAAQVADAFGRRAASAPTADGSTRPAGPTPASRSPRALPRRFGDLRAAGGARPRRHGRRLQGAAGQPRPHRRAEDDALRGDQAPASEARALPRRGARRRRGSSTRTSCRSTRSASATGSRTSRMQLRRGRDAGGRCCDERPLRPREAAALARRRSPGPSTTPTSSGILHRDLKPSNILLASGEARSVPVTAQLGLAHARTARRVVPSSPTSAWPSASRAATSLTAHRRDPRHAELHGARAGGRQPRHARPRQRRLLPGRHPLRDAHRPAAVPGRDAASTRCCWCSSRSRCRRGCSTRRSIATWS